MTRMIIIICWIVVAVVFIGLAFWLLTGNLFGIHTDLDLSEGLRSFGIEQVSGPYDRSYEYSLDAGSVEALRIDWVAGSVSVTPYAGDSIQITEWAQRDLGDKELLRYEQKGDRLVIQYCDSTGSFLKNLPAKRLEVLVPQSLAENLRELDVDVTTAEVTVQNLSGQSFSFDSTSGRIDAAGIRVSELRADTTSGRIELTDADAGQIVLASVSGQINASAVTADAIDCETVSGAQKLSGGFSGASLSSVSGALSLSSQIMPDRADCDTVSGAIRIDIPKTDSVSVYYDSVSGRLSSDFPVTLVSRGDAQFRFSTVSGSMTLSALEDAEAPAA